MTEIKTGTDVLRAAVRGRVKRRIYGGLAHDIGIDADSLIAFSEDRKTLPPHILTALAKEFWGDHVTFDETENLLRSLTPPLRPMGIVPESYHPEKRPAHWSEPIGPWTTGGVQLPPPQARPAKRPGWAR